MAILRTPEGKRLYDEYQRNPEFTGTCVLCSVPALKNYKHWKIVKNSFPYDRIAKVHDMLLPLRHTNEEELTLEELEELKNIKKEILNSDYEFILEATNKRKSIPAHFHLHLIIVKE